MAYFAVYEKSDGEIKNTVECPDFLTESIHLDDDQDYIQVDFQVSPSKYCIQNNKLIEKD